MSVFVEACDAFRRETAAKREDEEVIRQVAFELAVSDRDFLFVRIDARDFGFDEVYASIQHRVTEVEGDVFLLTLAECEAHQRGIENKITTARDQGDLVLVAELLGKTFGGHDAAESTAKNQNLRHLRYPRAESRHTPCHWFFEELVRFLEKTAALARVWTCEVFPSPLKFRAGEDWFHDWAWAS